MAVLTSPEVRALAVACPDCQAAIGVPCTTGSGVVRTWPHVVREKAAAKAAKRQQAEAAAPPCGGDVSCKTHQGGKFDLFGERECRR